MSVNKVNLSNGEILIDLTNDSVTPETLAEGETAHDASGNVITGTMPIPAPDYVVNEAARVARVVRQRQSASAFSLMAITDAHWLDNAKALNSDQRYIPTSVKHAGMGMNEIKNLVDLGVVLGDNGWGAKGSTTVEEGIQEITATNKAIAKAFTGIPNLRIYGNHCPLSYNYTANGNKYIDSAKLYELYGSYNTGATFQSGNEDRGYCYQDFPEHKLRVICMNTVDIKGLSTTSSAFTNGIFVSSTQLNWLASVLDMSSKGNDAENWRIIIVSHHPIDYGMAILSCNIIKAYLEGKTFSATNYTDNGTYSCDFSKGNNKAKIIANIHGHNHNYAVAPLRYLVSGSTTAQLPAEINRICIPNACFLRENERAEESPKADALDIDYGEYNANGSILFVPKTKETGTDTAFAVVTIDSNSNIYVAYYGARPVDEKVIAYGDVVRYTITNTLTNVITNNASDKILAGQSYTATLTAKSGYEIKTVTVTMGGTDITSSCYNNGVITISEVTGNVVITATAEEIPEVDLLHFTSRTAGSQGTTNTWLEPTSQREFDYNKYYYTAVDSGKRGSYPKTKVTALNVTDNSVEITTNSTSGYGVEFPVELEAGKTYTFEWTISVAQSRVFLLKFNNDTTYNSQVQMIDPVYTNSNAAGSYKATITPEAGYKYSLLFSNVTASKTPFTNISLTEK